MLSNPVVRNILRASAYVLSAVLCLCTLLSAYGGYMPPRIWAFPSVLTLVFVPLGILTVVAGGVWLLCRRWIAGAAMLLVALLSAPGWSCNFPIHLIDRKIQPGQRCLTVLNYNVHGLEWDRKSGLTVSPTLSYIISSDADVVCLQEAYGSVEHAFRGFQSQIDSLYRIYPYREEYVDNDLRFLSKYPLTRIPKTGKLGETRFLTDIQEVDFDGVKICLVNVHLTSYGLDKDEKGVLSNVEDAQRHSQSAIGKLERSFARRGEVAQGIVDNLARLDYANVIVCGDFNDVPGSWAYRKLTRAGLRDAYVETGIGPMFTFNAWHMYFHIDQILYKGPALYPISCHRGTLRSSDHFPVLTRFAVNMP